MTESMPYRCYAVLLDRRLLREFAIRAAAETFALAFPGSIVTPMTIPVREN